MGKLVFGMNISLDGYVDGPSGNFEMGPPGPKLFRYWIEHIRGVAATVYGRRMYEVMSYWDDDQPEWDEPRRVAYRWNNDDALGSLPEHVQEEGSTVFTFTLDEVDGGTQLDVIETGFENTSAPLENLESHRTGWNEELDKLVRLVEEDATKGVA